MPNDFTIVIVDYSGDGWIEGSYIYIDGYGEYTLESGFYDTISNCNDIDGFVDDEENDWVDDDTDDDSGSSLNCQGV